MRGNLGTTEYVAMVPLKEYKNEFMMTYYDKYPYFNLIMQSSNTLPNDHLKLISAFTHNPMLVLLSLASGPLSSPYTPSLC